MPLKNIGAAIWAEESRRLLDQFEKDFPTWAPEQATRDTALNQFAADFARRLESLPRAVPATVAETIRMRFRQLTSDEIDAGAIIDQVDQEHARDRDARLRIEIRTLASLNDSRTEDLAKKME